MHRWGSVLRWGCARNGWQLLRNGGTNNFGTIFQITPKDKYTVLHSFENPTGALFGNYPEVTLLQNTNGIVYGDTSAGGNAGAGYGVFFRFNMNLKPFVSQGLTGTMSVSFNGTPATSFTVVSDTYLTAVVPSGTTPGLRTVTGHCTQDPLQTVFLSSDEVPSNFIHDGDSNRSGYPGD